jgi:DNA polymerase-3 subunit epsilon
MAPNRNLDSNKVYTIVDLETTGMQGRGHHRVTEIALIRCRGTVIEKTFKSLIHPERKVPWAITRLTGINNDMLVDAPKFYQVAKTIVEFFENATLVAHNAHFDYSFLKMEFQQLGYDFKVPNLCTVKLSRRIFPEIKRYSLSHLCEYFNIKNQAHHRAWGDAEATHQLFKRIIEKTDSPLEHIQDKLSLPPQLDQQLLDDLPERPGIYYFFNAKAEVLYIGKSINIRKRVRDHFRPATDHKKLTMGRSITDIQFQLTGNDLAARLLEASEIKKFRPPLNRSLNRTRFPYHLFLEQDSAGFCILKYSSNQPSAWFKCTSQKKAQKAIERFYLEAFGDLVEDLENQGLGTPHLILRLPEIKNQLGKEEYNQRLHTCLSAHRLPYEHFKINLDGRSADEICVVEVCQDSQGEIRFIGPSGQQKKIPLVFDFDSKQIILSHLKKHPSGLEIIQTVQ